MYILKEGLVISQATVGLYNRNFKKPITKSEFTNGSKL